MLEIVGHQDVKQKTLQVTTQFKAPRQDVSHVKRAAFTLDFCFLILAQCFLLFGVQEMIA